MMNANRSYADRTVVAVFDTSATADRALELLREAGYSNRDITLVTRNSEAGETVTNMAASDSATKQAGVGAAVGGIGGAALAFLGAGTALAIPGVGPLLLAAGGALAGASAGGWIGSLFGLQTPDDVAQRYAELAASGHFILFVRPFQGEQGRVEDLLRQGGAQDIENYSYTFSPNDIQEAPGADVRTEAGPDVQSQHPSAP